MPVIDFAAMKTILAFVLLGGVALAAPQKKAASPIAEEARAFLDLFNSLYLGMARGSQEAQWVASTDVSEAHEGERTGANTMLAIFQGDRKVIETARRLLDKRKQLPPVVARQIDKILLAAAEGPGTIPDATKARVAAESHQSALMDGFTYKLDGK